jgi:hypothetical protein
MWSIIFLGFSLFFSWLVYEAWATGQVKGRGWWFTVRYYSREDEPVMFWINTGAYGVIVVWTFVFGVMALGH